MWQPKKSAELAHQKTDKAQSHMAQFLPRMAKEGPTRRRTCAFTDIKPCGALLSLAKPSQSKKDIHTWNIYNSTTSSLIL